MKTNKHVSAVRTKTKHRNAKIATNNKPIRIANFVPDVSYRSTSMKTKIVTGVTQNSSVTAFIAICV